MTSRTLKEQCLRIISINQNPIGFKVTITRTLPLADQSVITVIFMKGMICCKHPNHICQLIEILSPFLKAPNISFELAGLNNRFHSFPAFNQCIHVFKTLQIASGTRIIKGPFRFLIWNFNGERKAIAQRNLCVKHTNGLCWTNAKTMQNRLRVLFCLRIDTTVNGCRFHGSNCVANAPRVKRLFRFTLTMRLQAEPVGIPSCKVLEYDQLTRFIIICPPT